MKLFHKGIVALAFVMLFALAGCAKSDVATLNSEQHDHEHDHEHEYENNYVSQETELIPDEEIVAEDWPENDYTINIPKMSVGRVERTEELEDDGRYIIYMSDIAESDVEEYIGLLQHIGYELVNEEHEEVSMGAILKNHDTCISLALSKTDLTIEIIDIEGVM